MATPITTPTRVVTLNPGDCFILPDGAELVSVIVNGSASVSSTCEDNIPVGTYRCWRFYWESSNSGYDDVLFKYIQIGGVKYALPDININANSANNLAYYIPLVTPAGLVTEITTTPSEQTCIAFKIPDSLGEPLLYWNNPSVGDGIFIPAADVCGCS